MISIITCSINPSSCQMMLDSIKSTIGVEYEEIVFENKEKNYGLCKAYNEAAAKSNFDYLCFLHEDVIIKTNSWGKELILFTESNKDCGVIGVAGGKYAYKNFFSWCVQDQVINVYDGWGSGKNENFNESDLILKNINPNKEKFSRVICLDGLFFFVKKDVWLKNKFDENTFTGFHFYDADFTFSISHHYQNYAYLNMDIYHFSLGKVNKNFCKNMYLFQKKWKKKLPCCLPDYKITYKNELNMAIHNFGYYHKNGFSLIECFIKIFIINGFSFFFFFILLFISKLMIHIKSLKICKKVK